MAEKIPQKHQEDLSVKPHVALCVCVYEWVREQEKESEKDKEKKGENVSVLFSLPNETQVSSLNDSGWDFPLCSPNAFRICVFGV